VGETPHPTNVCSSVPKIGALNARISPFPGRISGHISLYVTERRLHLSGVKTLVTIIRHASNLLAATAMMQTRCLEQSLPASGHDSSFVAGSFA
jgi:hypothetical protein